MSVPNATFTWTLGPDLSEIAAMSDAVAGWAHTLHVPEAATSAMTLMLEELAANSITHGYAETGTTGDVDLRLETDGKALVAYVSDTAPEFNPLDLPPADTSSALEDRAIGGLGVHLVRRLAHSVNYQRINGRNVFCVSRRFGPDGERCDTAA